jgi:hypothetical protein
MLSFLNLFHPLKICNSMDVILLKYTESHSSLVQKPLLCPCSQCDIQELSGKDPSSFHFPAITVNSSH